MASLMLKKLPCSALALVLGLALAVGPAGAADDKKGGEQLRRLQQRLRAVEQEKSQLVQGKSELDIQLKDGADKLLQAKRSADTAGRQRGALEKELKAAEAEKDALEGKLADSEKTLADTTQRLGDTTSLLRVAETARRALEANLATRTLSLSECVTKNTSLHGLGVTLLRQYEEKTCFGNGMQRELLTQIKRVGVENMVDEYRDKLDLEQINLQQDRQLLARQKAEEPARLAKEQAERISNEKEKTAKLKARQQNDLDKMTRKVKDMLENIEW